MEDKTFDLLEKMYADINKRFNGLEEEMKHAKKGYNTSVIR